MALDPYAELRVDRSASAEEIKAAFRRRIREVHPDHHPDDPFAAAKTQQVLEAYEILSDAGRRAAYDGGHGPTTGKQQLHIDGMAVDLLIALFLESLKTGVGAGVVALLEKKVQERLREGDAIVKGNGLVLQRLRAVRDRFRCKSGENFLAHAIDNQIEQIGAQVEEVSTKLAAARRALELLKNFEDIEQQLLGGWRAGTLYIDVFQ